MQDFGKPGRLRMCKGDDDIEQPVDPLSLVSATGDIEIRVINTTKALSMRISSISTNNLTSPRRYLQREFLISGACLYRTHRPHTISCLVGALPRLKKCGSYFRELDSEIVASEEFAKRFYVLYNQAIFLQQKDPKDALKGLIFSLTGAGSIFETLFKRSDVCSKRIPDVLYMADYMIAFMWQSCIGERSASHINSLKSVERTDICGRYF